MRSTQKITMMHTINSLTSLPHMMATLSPTTPMTTATSTSRMTTDRSSEEEEGVKPTGKTLMPLLDTMVTTLHNPHHSRSSDGRP